MFVAWAETMLVHGEGDLLGEPYRVPEWLKRAAYRIFEYDPETFRYIVREVLIVCPKGSAKTEGMAAVALFLLAGPSMPTADGPVMRPSPNIPVAAASWEQAGRLFKDAATNMAKGTVDKPSPLAPFVECFEAAITLKDAPGKLYRVAAVAGTNDGGLPTAGFADELHEWTGKKERVHLVLFQGLDKRTLPGFVVNITTPDDADPESLLGRKAGYGEQVATGEVVDPGFYFLHYGAPLDMATETESDLLAIVERSKVATWLDSANIVRKRLVDRMPLHEWCRYWGGQFRRGGGHWLPEGAWDAHRRPNCVWDDATKPDTYWPASDAPVVLAFDGSYKRDSTALIGCTLDGYVFVVGAWERPENAKDSWRVPRTQVLAAIDKAMERFTVVEFAPDPPGWATEIEGLEETYGEVVVRFETKQTTRMVPACGRFYAAVAPVADDDEPAELLLTHDGHPALARHLRNAVVVESRNTKGSYITKESLDSPRKIDLAVGAVIAYDRAMWHAQQRQEDEGGPNLW